MAREYKEVTLTLTEEEFQCVLAYARSSLSGLMADEDLTVRVLLYSGIGTSIKVGRALITADERNVEAEAEIAELGAIIKKNGISVKDEREQPPY